MDNYVEILISSGDEELRAIVIARLSELGYDGFEESDISLKAYIPEAVYDENDINNLLNHLNLTYSKSVIEKQNWNQIWESGFEPVFVEGLVGIRANFHQPLTGVAHDIIITPKMSFGTGHHATTWLVMKLMGEIDFRDTSVLDFGTGTGILAILAEKLGASHVRAVDNDDWCIENASENILINQCQYIDIEKVKTAESLKKYDIIIANINKNIILDNIGFISNALKFGGQLILSGLLQSDEADIVSVCSGYEISHIVTVNKNGWVAARFFRKS